jgi:hypothetical protein
MKKATTLGAVRTKATEKKKCAARDCPDVGKPTAITDNEQACKWTLSLCDFHQRLLQDENKLRLARENGIKGQ